MPPEQAPLTVPPQQRHLPHRLRRALHHTGGSDGHRNRAALRIAPQRNDLPSEQRHEGGARGRGVASMRGGAGGGGRARPRPVHVRAAAGRHAGRGAGGVCGRAVSGLALVCVPCADRQQVADRCCADPCAAGQARAGCGEGGVPRGRRGRRR